MKNLELLKKYLPSILYTVLGLAAVFIVYRMFMRFKGGALTVGGVIADSAENKNISKQTGIDASRIQQLRGVAHDIAYELETLKGMSYWDKLKHIQLDTDTIAILQNIRSADEMKIVKNFYQNIFTNNNSLLKDLKDVLSTKDLNKIPHIEALY